MTRGLRWRVLLRSRYLQEMSPVTIEDCDGAFKPPRTIGCVDDCTTKSIAEMDRSQL